MGRFSRLQQIYVTGLDLAVFLAGGFRIRLLGLSGLREEEIRSLLIPRCRSVHTVCMRSTIDVVFLRVDRRAFDTANVVALHTHMPTFRIAGSLSANAVLELPAGTVGVTGISVGDGLTFSRPCVRGGG